MNKGAYQVLNGRTFTLLLALAAAWLLPAGAGATHFRFGNLSWAPTTTPGEVEFKLTVALRRDSTTYGAFPGGVDQYAETGDIIVENVGGTDIAFGDGTPDTPTLQFVVTAFSTNDNWLIGEALHPGSTNRGVRHLYTATNAPSFLAGLNSCCRLGTTELNNRPDGTYILKSVVKPRIGNRSPITTLVPIITVPVSGAATFNLPALDPDGDPLRYRFANDFTMEAGTCCGPTNMVINPATGLVTWNNLGMNTNKFWTAQIIVEDLDTGGANQVVKSSSPVDFLLKIVPNLTQNTPPFCNISPPGPFTVPPGTPVSFAVRGTDIDRGQSISLTTGGLPGGATMTQPLPLYAFPPIGPSLSSANVTSVFNWTPLASQGGTYPIIYAVTDSAGNQSLCSAIVTVQPSSDMAIGKSVSPAAVVVGTPATFRLSVTNLGPSTAAGVTVTDILPAGLGNIFITSSQGACSRVDNTVTCTLGALAAGSNAVVNITATVNTQGIVTNTASVESDSTDPDVKNNTASAIVNAPNFPPVVSITSPTDGQVFSTPPGLVPVHATASDVDGTVAKVDFYVDGVFLAVSSNAPFNALLLTNAPGPYVLTAVATDDRLATGTSAPVNITIIPCDPQIAATPLVNQTVCVCDEATFTTTGTGTAPLAYAWKHDGVILPGETNRTLTLRGLKPHQAGAYTVEVSSPCASTSQSATLTLRGAGNMNPVPWANTNRIVITDACPARPCAALTYPSSIFVDCLPGPVKHVTVTLDGLNHNFPDDLDVLLVGPGGQTVKLMSDCGGGADLANAMIAFSDTATTPLPDASLITAGLYRPTDYGADAAFQPPAPGGALGATFASFLGTNGNGLWSLYIVDDQGGDAGSLARGWSLGLEWHDTPPELTAPAMLIDGRFQTTLLGLPRMAHVVEGSFNLSDWTPLSTNTLHGPLLITLDPPPAGPPWRFFRAVRCP